MALELWTARRRLVHVQAVELTHVDWDHIVEWIDRLTPAYAQVRSAGSFEQPHETLVVPTPEGPVQARLGDWIVRDDLGQFRVIAAARFAHEYERQYAAPYIPKGSA